MSGSREIIDLNLGPADSVSRTSSTSSQDKENLSDGEARGAERLGLYSIFVKYVRLSS